MDNKQKVLTDYVQKHNVAVLIAEKLSASTYTTPNFSYRAMRIGNSIGDSLDIGLTLVLAGAVAERFGLTLYTVENCEFHTKDVTEQSLAQLVSAAAKFEEIRHSPDYKRREKEARDVFAQNMKAMIG